MKVYFNRHTAISVSTDTQEKEEGFFCLQGFGQDTTAGSRAERQYTETFNRPSASKEHNMLFMWPFCGERERKQGKGAVRVNTTVNEWKHFFKKGSMRTFSPEAEMKTSFGSALVFSASVRPARSSTKHSYLFVWIRTCCSCLTIYSNNKKHVHVQEKLVQLSREESFTWKCTIV